jgi:hypothetical protein
VGKQIFLNVRKSQIHKFLGLFRYCKSANFLGNASPQIANPQIFIIDPQIATPQISAKHCTFTMLSQNSSKSCFFT